MKNYFLWNILLLTGSYNLYGGKNQKILRNKGQKNSILKEWKNDQSPEKIKNYNTTKDLLKEEKSHKPFIDVNDKNKNTIKKSSILESITRVVDSLLEIKYNDEKKEPIEWLEKNKKIAIAGGTILRGITGGAIYGAYFLHQLFSSSTGEYARNSKKTNAGNTKNTKLYE